MRSAPSPALAALHWDIATDVGLVRDHNEDAAAQWREQGIAVVADGMGGAAAGEVASGLAVDAVMTALRSDPRAPLATVIAKANTVVHEASRDPARRGMGTTLVVVRVTPRPEGLVAEIAHVGDSRAYLLYPRGLEQITEDHGIGHLLTRVIGPSARAPADITEVPLRSPWALLLCSDGIHGYLTSGAMARLLAPALDPRVPLDAARRLVRAANQAGGEDNATAIVLAG